MLPYCDPQMCREVRFFVPGSTVFCAGKYGLVCREVRFFVMNFQQFEEISLNDHFNLQPPLVSAMWNYPNSPLLKLNVNLRQITLRIILAC